MRTHQALPVALLATGVAVALTGTALAGGADHHGSHRAHERNRVVQAPALPGAQPISSRDRVYTADQSSNTVSVIDPSTNRVLGTLPLGSERLGEVLGPQYDKQVDVHGLGFSRDGRLLDVISVTTNAAQLIGTRTNAVVRTTYVGRAPHEGFISPDGRTLWVAVRGQDYISIISVRTGRELRRVRVEARPSKVVFSPDGRRAYVNHLGPAVVDVISVRSARVIARVSGVAPGSSDEALSPDGRELWLGHPALGKTSVVDARRFRTLAVFDTGPRTNHPNFVSTRQGNFAYLTVGGLNQTLVFRRNGGRPQLVARIADHGEDPHGIWPSPDNTRVYVALQKSDAVDVIDTATRRVIDTLHIGQDPQALVYVANAVPSGSGQEHLTRQGLDKRVETLPVDVRGASGQAKATIREVQGTDEIAISAREFPPNATFTVYGTHGDGQGDDTEPLLDVTTNAMGQVDGTTAFADFFGVYDGVILTPKGQHP